MNPNAAIPRPEYPRPQAEREDWLNLNGHWEFEEDPEQTGEGRGLPSGRKLAGRILVPFAPESRLSGLGKTDFMPCVWYRRSFRVPQAWEGRQIVLHFGAVDYQATVWVNGELVGEHRGGYTPFCFDITQHLRDRDNELVVRAVDDTLSPLQPSGKQSDKPESYGCHYTRTTGIWQTVWLEPLPRTHLRSFRIYPDLDGKRVTIFATIDGDGRDARLNATARCSGNPVGRTSVPAGGSVLCTLDLAEVHAWGPGHPFLYDLELSLERDGEEVDRVRSYFGLRKLQIDGKRVLLNGVPVFQRLVLDQGYYPDGLYTAPTDEALRRDVELSLAMGFNGARLHQKVFEPRFLYWADKLGYLLWGEYPNWGLDHSHPGALQSMLPEWVEVLLRDHNHPSLIGWCPFNETPVSQDPDLIRTIYRATKALDPTRPVIDTSGYVHVETDIYDCHHYGQDPEEFATSFEDFKTRDRVWRNFPEDDAPYRGQPYFVSEYGGLWWNPGQSDERAWGYGERPNTEGEFLTRYRALTETLLLHPRMFGFCYTQLYDIEQEVNGLYTYDRRPKFDPAIIHRINSQPSAIEAD